MEQMAADAAYARIHEKKKWHNGDGTSWAEFPSATHPYRFDFGVTIGVADVDLRPWDKFTTRESWVAPDVDGDVELDEDGPR